MEQRRAKGKGKVGGRGDLSGSKSGGWAESEAAEGAGEWEIRVWATRGGEGRGRGSREWKDGKGWCTNAKRVDDDQEHYFSKVDINVAGALLRLVMYYRLQNRPPASELLKHSWFLQNPFTK